MENKTETFSHDNLDGHHHHKSQPGHECATRCEHATQPENNSLTKYFRMWCAIFSNENSLTNTVKPVNSCEHRSKCRTRMSPQILQHECSDKRVPKSTTEESPRRSFTGWKPSMDFGKYDKEIRKAIEIKEPNLHFVRKHSPPIQEVNHLPPDFESEKVKTVRDMKENLPYE